MVMMKLIGVNVLGGTTNKFIDFFSNCFLVGINPLAQLRHTRVWVCVVVRFTLDFVVA
jgi:hypothetical protein